METYRDKIRMLKSYLSRINKEQIKVIKGYGAGKQTACIRGLIAEIILADLLNEDYYKANENIRYLYLSLDYLLRYKENFIDWEDICQKENQFLISRNLTIDNLFNYMDLKVLRNNTLHKFSPFDYKAVSTTDSKYSFLSSQDTDTDIVWIDIKTQEPLFLSNLYFPNYGHPNYDNKVGLQIKTTYDGRNYLSKRYNVPIIYFGFTNDYRETKKYLKEKWNANIDEMDLAFIDGEILFPEILNNLDELTPLIRKYVTGRIKKNL